MTSVELSQPGGAMTLARTAKLCFANNAKSRSPQALRAVLAAGASLVVLVLAGGLMAGPAIAQTVATTTTLQATAGGATADDLAIAAGFQEAVSGDATLTIDLDDLDVTTATIINDSSGSAVQQLTIRVLDADGVGAFGANNLTITGPVTASNGGVITLQVGQDSPDAVGVVFHNDITETTGGEVRIEIGGIVGSDLVRLRFSPTSASQTVDAAISHNGGNTEISIDNSTVAGGATLTFTDTVTLDGVTDRITIQETFDDMTVVFESDVTAEILVNGGSLILGRDGATSTVTGTIDGAGGVGAISTLLIADGANVILDGQLHDSSTGWTSITVGEGSATSFTINGSTSNQSPITLSDNATLNVQATNAGTPNISGGVFADAAGSFTTLRVIGDPGHYAWFTGSLGATDNRVDLIDLDASAHFSTASHFLGSLDIASGATARFAGFGTNFASISGDVSGEGEILIFNLGNVLTFDGGSTPQIIATPILFNANQHGIIQTANTAGLTFNGPIGGTNAAQDVNIAPGNIVTFNGAVLTDGFEILGPNTVVTVNGGEAGAATSAISGGRLQIGQSTIRLGSNIGHGDTVFDFPFSDRPIMPGAEVITVQVSAHVREGDEIVLFSTDQDQSNALDSPMNPGSGNGEVVVVDTALTDFSLNLANSNEAITLTAVDRTTDDVATLLGVSEEEAAALQQATESGDETLIDLLTEALVDSLNDPAAAAQAAQQVGVQSESVAAGSSVGGQMAGELKGVTQDRLVGFRSDSPRFVSAFSSMDSGFSGGDLGGAYAPMAPRYANSLWGQVYGGVATSDGTTALAGFDAGFGGALIGIDGAPTDAIVIGAFAGYGLADVDGDGAGMAKLETSAFQAGLYGSYTGASFYVDGFAAFAMMQNDTSRTTVGNNILTGTFDSSQFTFGLSAGAPIAISHNAYITPNASVTWNSYDADGYTEVGVGANMVSGIATNTLTGKVGARIHAVHTISNGSEIVPELSAGLLYDLINDDAIASATFVGGGSAYTVRGTEIADIGVVLGVGLSMHADAWSFGLAYDGEIRSDFMSHTGRAEVRWSF
jgi:uncharacterized protein with beta-barrel porin domain